MEISRSNMGGLEVLEKEARMSNKKSLQTCDSLLRLLALALTLTATILLGVSKQTKIVPIRVVDTLPPINISVTSKWHYFSAFVYFVVAHAIACSYVAISLILLNRKHSLRRSGGLSVFVTIFDAVIAGLLLSSNGAVAAIGFIAYKGNTHLQWKKVCNMFGKFCTQAVTAVVLSLLGGITLLLLVVIAVKSFHKK